MMPQRRKQMESIADKINRELGGRGQVTIEQVALIAAGVIENESHPISQRIIAELKEKQL